MSYECVQRMHDSPYYPWLFYIILYTPFSAIYSILISPIYNYNDYTINNWKQSTAVKHLLCVMSGLRPLYNATYIQYILVYKYIVLSFMIFDCCMHTKKPNEMEWLSCVWPHYVCSCATTHCRHTICTYSLALTVYNVYNGENGQHAQ